MSLYNEKLFKKLAEKELFRWFVKIASAELGKIDQPFYIVFTFTLKKLKTFRISPTFLMINEYTPA